jgi:hypothetical protein
VVSCLIWPRHVLHLLHAPRALAGELGRAAPFWLSQLSPPLKPPPRPRWLVEGRLVGGYAVQLGGGLRLAAYVFHREAVKARRVRGCVRAAPGGRPQAAAEGPAGPL